MADILLPVISFYCSYGVYKLIKAIVMCISDRIEVNRKQKQQASNEAHAEYYRQHEEKRKAQEELFTAQQQHEDFLKAAQQQRAWQYTEFLRAATNQQQYWQQAQWSENLFRWSQQNQQQTQPPQSIPPHYSLLGIEINATNDQIKKQYKRLMSQYHPDKIAGNGGTEAQIKEANALSQHINEAYNKICKERNI